MSGRIGQAMIMRYIGISHNEGGKCPWCVNDNGTGGTLIMRKRKTDGRAFLGCSRFPECKFIENRSFEKSKLKKFYKKRKK